MEKRSHLYLDEYLSRYSNVALGLIARALGYNLKVAYFNSKNNQADLIEFFKGFDIDFHFSDYIPEKLDYDLVIFDNFNLENLNEDEVFDLIKGKGSEYVFVSSEKDEFDKIKDSFDLVSQYRYEENSGGRDNLLNITGNGKGKSTWCFGEIIRRLIKRNRIKLIYFDKGGDIYGELFFFRHLANDNLNISVTGTQRFDGKSFRFENTQDDFIEAKKGLEELKGAQGYDLVVAEELNAAINSKLIDEIEAFDIIRGFDSDLLISGRYARDSIMDLSFERIDVAEISHYSKKGHRVKEGIDY